MILAALAIWELVIVGVLGLAFLILLANEVRGYATLLFFITLGLIGWFAWEPVKEFFAQPGSGMLTVKYVALYLLAGLVFAVFKWVLYSRRKAKEYQTDVAEFSARRAEAIKLYEQNVAELEGLIASGKEEGRRTLLSMQNDLTSAKLKLVEHQASTVFCNPYTDRKDGKNYGIIRVYIENGERKTKIALDALSGYVAAWASYWPAYAVLLILDDFLRAVWDVVTQWLRRVFQSITAWAFKV
jgi:hypothetical protein